jgi:hypothetical protein
MMRRGPLTINAIYPTLCVILMSYSIAATKMYKLGNVASGYVKAGNFLTEWKSMNTSKRWPVGYSVSLAGQL